MLLVRPVPMGPTVSCILAKYSIALQPCWRSQRLQQVRQRWSIERERALCCSYRCAVTQHQCTATMVKANCISHCLMLLCKTGSLQACVTSMTPMDICCSFTCAVTQHQCTATLWSGQTAIPTAICCSAKQAQSRLLSLQ